MSRLTKNITFLQSLRNQVLWQSRNISIKIQPAAPKFETIKSKASRRKMPLSPSFTIYQPQLTTILSISHRISGLALVSYSTMIAFNALLGHHNFMDFVTVIEGFNMNQMSLMAFKYAVAFPFAFHGCMGVRHIIWDTGSLLSLKGVYSSGYAALLSAFLLAGALSYI